MAFNPTLEETQAEAKKWLDQNIWDGEDRIEAELDSVSFNPKDLQELVFDILEHLADKRYL